MCSYLLHLLPINDIHLRTVNSPKEVRGCYDPQNMLTLSMLLFKQGSIMLSRFC